MLRKEKKMEAAYVKAKKINKLTGSDEDIIVRFAELPAAAKTKWIKERNDKYPQYERRQKQRSDQIYSIRRQRKDDDDDVDSDNDDGGGDSDVYEPQPSTSQKKQGEGMRKSNKLIDFNFIPYNVKNRIIYE